MDAVKLIWSTNLTRGCYRDSFESWVLQTLMTNLRCIHTVLPGLAVYCTSKLWALMVDV